MKLLKKRIAVLISGNGSNLQAIIDAIDNGIIQFAEIACVISNRKGAYGLQRAERAGICTEIVNTKMNKEDWEDDILDYFREYKVDLVVLAGWMKLLSANFLCECRPLPYDERYPIARNGIINLHPALPGEYAGIKAIERVFADWMNGKLEEREWGGVMVHHVVEEMDAGAVIVQRRVPFVEGDTLETYEERVHATEHVAIVEAVQQCLYYKRGKVRDLFELGSDRMIIHHSDRLSAFDRAICQVEGKGQLLCRTAAFWFKWTSHIINNHYLWHEDATMIVRKATVIPIEVVVRGYITGSTGTSLWTRYESGSRGEEYGLKLPDGLVKHCRLACPVITPTTKAEIGDEPITPEAIVENGIVTNEEWNFIASRALELYHFGNQVAKRAGLILADTKYEFGRLPNGEIILIDEIHTGDSSRYWLRPSYEERLQAGLDPERWDKDIIRTWLKNEASVEGTDDKWDPYDLSTVVPKVSEGLVDATRSAYANIFEVLISTCGSLESALIETQDVYRWGSSVDHYTGHRIVVIAENLFDSFWVSRLYNEFMRLKSGFSADVSFRYYVASVRQSPKHVLDILEMYNPRSISGIFGGFGGRTVYITVAGCSNALSGFCAANTSCPVIACPPYKDKLDMMVNLNSTLQMPSQTPVLTVLNPNNAILAVARILDI